MICRLRVVDEPWPRESFTVMAETVSLPIASEISLFVFTALPPRNSVVSQLSLMISAPSR